MIEITHNKFSLFRTDKYRYITENVVTNSCFEFIETFDSLEEAKSAQKEYKESTIILPSY